MSQTNKLIEKFLVEPESLAPIAIKNSIKTSSDSRFQGKITQGVAVMSADTPASLFDDKFEVMAVGHSVKGGDWWIRCGQLMGKTS